MKKVILYFLIFLGLIACNRPNKEHLQKIAILQEQSQRALSEAQSKTDSLFSMQYQLLKDFDKRFINKMNWEDSLQRTLIVKFSDLEHSLKKYPEAKAEAIRLANLSLHQLANLKEDEENGLLKNEEFEKYYQQEQDALVDVGNAVSNLQFQQKLIKNTYEKLVPLMKDIKDTAKIK